MAVIAACPRCGSHRPPLPRLCAFHL